MIFFSFDDLSGARVEGGVSLAGSGLLPINCSVDESGNVSNLTFNGISGASDVRIGDGDRNDSNTVGFEHTVTGSQFKGSVDFNGTSGGYDQTLTHFGQGTVELKSSGGTVTIDTTL